MNKPQELLALTSLRGLAALFVLLHHATLVFTEELARAMPSQLLVKSYLWVDLFFILSGFVLAYVYRNFAQGVDAPGYRQFVWARVARIYPLHLFMLLMFLLLECLQWIMVWQGNPNTRYWTAPFTGAETPVSFLSNLTLLQTFHWDGYWNPPAWSISAEFLTYLWLPWLLLWLPKAPHWALASLALAVLLVLGVMEWHFGDLGLKYAGWPQLLRASGEAYLGVLAYLAFQRGWLMPLQGQWLLPLFVACVLLLALPVPAVVNVLSFLLLVLVAARHNPQAASLFNHPWLVHLGRISFALYLGHWLVFDIARQLSLLYTGKGLGGLLGFWGELVCVLVGTVLSLLLAQVLWRSLEQPAREWLLKSGRFLPKV
jgi:peptidoglycan/LPS O-acetylase OafA/YrhL